MKEEISIRQADASEMKTLMQWRMEVLHAVFDIPDKDPLAALRKANEEYYHTALADGSHIACFAEQNGTAVGCGGVCLFREMPSPDNPCGRCAYLMNIYTRPSCRGSGVGRKIVTWLVEKARAKGITKIYLESSDSARSLYEGLGFIPMKNYLKLDDGGTK
ncbi:MAG: GNAT family N-acetyltransferase [Lachnospiraceae bacterium]|jgi:GNAT superfamily N-acetyltransferase|nr:GNAT family N-acetyltransferase [Lachnospiraceae bacterium]